MNRSIVQTIICSQNVNNKCFSTISKSKSIFLRCVNINIAKACVDLSPYNSQCCFPSNKRLCSFTNFLNSNHRCLTSFVATYAPIQKKEKCNIKSIASEDYALAQMFKKLLYCNLKEAKNFVEENKNSLLTSSHLEHMIERCNYCKSIKIPNSFIVKNGWILYFSNRKLMNDN